MKSKFLITHFHRAGSTYLQNLLGSHKNVVCYFRPFGSDIFFDNKEDWYNFLYNYKNKFRLDKIKSSTFWNTPMSDIKKNINNPIQIMDWVYGEYSEDILSVGVKVSFIDIQKKPTLKEYFQHSDIKIIILHRKNLLKQVYSYTKALDSSDWVYQPHENRTMEKKIYKFDYSWCKRRFEKIEKYYKVYANDVFKNNKIDVFYEDLIDNRNDELDKIFNFIGVEFNEEQFNPIVPNKMNLYSMNQVISNYSELKDKFKDSKYSIFFDE